MELVHEHRFETRQQARAEISEFIEVWYNRQRLHSSLGYMSPVNYEATRAAQNLPLAA